ncbi:MAG: glycosyltransferase family 2 protein, partial [Pseudorhodobacter sp.]|nr:glycosyltransferase family 2 protein [Pseudorhodobacter sp.]
MTARHTLISGMKDEGPYIVEWVAHHLVLGFDRICVASNDCRDGSGRLLDALAAAGFIEHLANTVAAGQIPQHAGYAAMRAAFGIDRTEWLAVLDADEFLNVHVGAGMVGDLTALAGDADIISLHALCFADQPEVNWRPGPIVPRFPWALERGHKANRAMKSLTRDPGRFKDIHNHSLVGFRGKATDLRILSGDGLRWNPLQGVPLWQQLRNADLAPDAHRLAQYNHYAVKTWDSFNLRRERGRGAVAVTDATTIRHTDAYFRDRNGPVMREESIARYQPAVAAQIARMLAVPAVAAAQAECVRIYGALCAPYRRMGGIKDEIA